MLKRWQENLIKEFALFFLWCLIFSIYRLIFIFVLKDNSIGPWDITLSMFYGFRLSLKTAGIICLIGGILATLPHTFFPQWPADTIRKGWHGLCFCYSLLLFIIRIPYYQVFNSTYDLMLINGFYDDTTAILKTMVEQYKLVDKLGIWLLASIILLLLGKFFYNRYIGSFTLPETKWWINLGRSLAGLAFLAIWFIFCRWGGGINYNTGINWENCAKLKSHLLNEAILDDGQALYRVYCMYDLSRHTAKADFTPKELQAKLKLLGKNPNSYSINKAFEHVAPGSLFLAPQQIAIVIGESFGQWPFEERFASLNLVPQCGALAKKGCHIPLFLPHGSGTIASLNGFLSGLPNTGIYENYNANMLKKAQPTGAASLMKALGYTTHFWYGGFSCWQNIKEITLAQGFDKFHCADEFQFLEGSAWDCSDKDLFAYVTKYMQDHPKEKMFHIILTSSNHPPYKIDLSKEGFPKEQVQAAQQKIPAIPKDEDTLIELGHIWYGDATTGNFVHTTEKIIPNSLFVITGDCSKQFNFTESQSLAIRSTVPCIFYGPMITKDFLQTNFGEHLDILPTIVEAIAPAGYTYSSFGRSLRTIRDYNANHALIVSEKGIEPIKSASQDIQNKIAARRDVAVWRIMKGDKF